jgi:hypothetical protein
MDEDDDLNDHVQASCFNGLFRPKHRPSKQSQSPPTPPIPPEIHRHFGVPLETLYKSEELLTKTDEGLVPLVAYLCINYLRNVLHLEGIFRVSGTWKEMNTLKGSFEEGNIPNFSICENPHSIAGLLELFLRSLPDPVLSNRLYDDFLSVGDKPEEERVGAMKSVIQRLPQEHLQFLRFLIPFFKDITNHAGENKMDAKNLSIIFGPILFGGGEMSLLFMAKLKTQASLVEILIRFCDELLK